MKRFSFADKGAQKISKHVHFPVSLTLQSHFLSNTLASVTPNNLSYQLFAGEKQINCKQIANCHLVISHLGNCATDGHYTCNILQTKGKYKQWLHIDDSSVQYTTVDRVLESRAYLLFYQQGG